MDNTTPTNNPLTDPLTDLFTAVRDLVEKTRDLDYDPSQEAWICGPHGLPECTQENCPSLPWPAPNSDPILAEFTDWATREFLRIVRPFDLSDEPGKEMPDEAFRSYSVWEWPLGALLESDLAPPRPAGRAPR